MSKNMNKGKRSIKNSSPLYQIYTPTVILQTQTPQGEPVAKPETLLLIIL